jgi:tetratricopeptide (TPR) repeat protein
MQTPQKIYEDEYLELFHAEGESDFIVLTFNNMTYLANGKKFWAQNPLTALNISCIGLVSKKPDWMPVISQECERLIGAITQKYSKTIGYGFSMGAYSAIKYSRKLLIDDIIAISPQISIKPDDVGDFDNRYSQHYNPKQHDCMRIISNDLYGSINVIYDPNFVKDTKHAEAIARLSDDKIKLIATRNINHKGIEMFLGKQVLAEVFESANDNKLTAYLQKNKNKLKKNSSSYYLYLGNECLKKNKQRWGIDILQLARNLAPNNERILIALANAYSEIDDNQKALSYSGKAIQASSSDKAWDCHSRILLADNKIDESVRALIAAWVSSGNIHYIRRATAIYETAKLYTKAIETLKIAKSVKPEDIAVLTLSARINHHLEEYDAAIEDAALAHKNAPEDIYILTLYARVLVDAGHYILAIDILQTAIKNGIIHPNIDRWLNIAKDKEKTAALIN